MEKLQPDIIIKNWDVLYKLYVADNDDVQLSGYTDYNNSLRHFIKFGFKENRGFGIELNNDTLIKLRKNKIVKNTIFSSNDKSNIITKTYSTRSERFFKSEKSIDKKDISNFERNYLMQNNLNNPIKNKFFQDQIDGNNEESNNNLDKHKFVDLLEFNEDDFTIEPPKILQLNNNDLLLSEESEIDTNQHNNTEERSNDSINIIEEFKN